jgi:hypothetical protein
MGSHRRGTSRARSNFSRCLNLVSRWPQLGSHAVGVVQGWGRGRTRLGFVLGGPGSAASGDCHYPGVEYSRRRLPDGIG